MTTQLGGSVLSAGPMGSGLEDKCVLLLDVLGVEGEAIRTER